MKLDHTKYQSLSAVEAHAAVRDVEKLVTDAADAGYSVGFEAAINKIIGVNTGSCSVMDCKNYNLAYTHNCSAYIVSECVDYKGGGQS